MINIDLFVRNPKIKELRLGAYFVDLFLVKSLYVWRFISFISGDLFPFIRVSFFPLNTNAPVKQGTKGVPEYAIQLQNLWQELDHYQIFEMKFTDGVSLLKNFIEKDLVYDFLAGLNLEFDQVRVQILGKRETSPLEETISIIRTKESRRNIMLEIQPKWGPSSIPSLSRARWFVIFIDDCTQVSRVFHLKQQSEVSQDFKNLNY